MIHIWKEYVQYLAWLHKCQHTCHPETNGSPASRWTSDGPGSSRRRCLFSRYHARSCLGFSWSLWLDGRPKQEIAFWSHVHILIFSGHNCTFSESSKNSSISLLVVLMLNNGLSSFEFLSVTPRLSSAHLGLKDFISLIKLVILNLFNI